MSPSFIPLSQLRNNLITHISLTVLKRQLDLKMKLAAAWSGFGGLRLFELWFSAHHICMIGGVAREN